MTLNLRWAPLALLLPVVAVAAPPPDPILETLAYEAQQARSLARSPRAVAHLLRLHELRDEVGDLHPLAQTYTDLTFRRASHPEVRRVARLLLSDIERARGRSRKSQELLKPLGYIQDFYVLGAFDNEGKSGCDVDHGPEAELDLNATYTTRERETRWRPLPVAPLDGYVDLSNVLRPNKDAVAYALTFLDAPAESRAELSVGVSGAFKLWVNGEQVAAESRYNQPRPDQARVAVKLRKGQNRVLLKVCQETGPLGFYLRQERVAGARASVPQPLPSTLSPLPKGPGPQAQPVPTVTTLLEREIARSPNDVELRGAYATVLDAFRAYDEREHTAVNVAQAAADAAPQNAPLQLLAAELHVEDHNLRRKYLRRALTADPSFARAKVALAQLELDRQHPERALAEVDAVIATHPRYVRAHLLRAQALAALEEWPRSVEQVERTFRFAPQVPIAVREAARTSRRMDRVQEAIQRYRAAIGLRFDDEGSRRALASALADQGRANQSAHELDALLKLSPFDNATRLRLAELWAANGKVEDALRQFEDAATLSPDEADVPERLGRALMHAGLREKALAAFERSLSLRPQNPALREAVRALQGIDASWGLQYAEDVSALAKEADAYAGEDAVSLVELAYTRVAASGQSSRFHQFAVKVFTQRGADAYRSFPITYSPNRQEVQVLKVRITRPDGSVVESFGETDRAINEPWSGMYYDARARDLTFPGLSPGDILEVQYRLEDTARENLLSDYWGDVDYVQSVMPRLRYRYLVDMPASRPLYWNKSQLPPGVKTEQSKPEEGRVLYSWSAERVAKIVPEPSMPGWAEVATPLHVSTYKNWEDVGRYWWGLVRDQLTPNDELRRTVDQALEGVDRKDDLAVVRAIYNFVVTHTRYVALEFGIHGYKPYRVDRVLARRFGDCKDKASLIHAMLKIAGVDSRLVLLRMRDLGTLTGEPASLAAFNHAIVYVPKHELYLDGTAAFHGATELPTADRVANVLIVEPDGQSRFLTTPESKPSDNRTHLEMDVTLAADGSAKVDGRSQVTGVQAPEYRRSYQAAATRRADFERGWAQTFPGLKVGKVALNDVARLDEAVQLTFDLDIPRYSEVLATGLRFFPFGSGRAYAQTYAPLVERTHDLVMGFPWSNSFTFRYTLPPGYTVAELPAEVNETSEFGSLRMGWRVENGTLICEGLIELGASRVSAKAYPAFRAFLGRVDQAFSRKLLVKKVSGGTTAQARPAGPSAHGG